MKRLILFWGLTILTFCSLWAAKDKDKPITPSLYINGTIIRDYGDIHSGTPALLVCVVKHKMVEPEEEPYMVALLINDDWQLIPLDEWEKYFRPDSVSKKDFWKLEQLKIVEYFDKKGMREKLRWEQKQEADQYILELEKSELFYDDAAIEDYLQCALLDIFPQEQLIKREEGVPIVRILKSSAPDIMMLANHTLLISTGMLAILDSEDELYALLSREVAHYINDHALITVAKNIARAKRAVFWGAVMDGVAEATEQYLYERYDYYEPGLVFATNDLIQSLVNQNIANRMGLDYSKEQEQEADDIANRYMSCIGRHTDALASALHKLNNYYQYEKDMEALNKYGTYGTLEERVSDMEISLPFKLTQNTIPVLVNEAGVVIAEGTYDISTGLATFIISETGSFFVKEKEIQTSNISDVDVATTTTTDITTAEKEQTDNYLFIVIAIIVSVITCSIITIIYFYTKKRSA